MLTREEEIKKVEDFYQDLELNLQYDSSILEVTKSPKWGIILKSWENMEDLIPVLFDDPIMEIVDEAPEDLVYLSSIWMPKYTSNAIERWEKEEFGIDGSYSASVIDEIEDIVNKLRCKMVIGKIEKIIK